MKYRLAMALVWLGSLGCLAVANAEEPQLTLNKGDRISVIGNTLAERMQHDGWIETFIQQRFPEHRLVFRNLSFSGDEIDKRPRSDNFGSADKWLTQTGADVIFAFFGYNEAFAGDAGLPAFRAKLSSFIDHTQGQKYNGESAPTLVLFSPIAHEDLKDPNLPDGSENNARLVQYTQAMSEVAAEKNVPFVDLFRPTRSAYLTAKSPLTMNGVHLNTAGNRFIAQLIDHELFGPPVGNGGTPTEALRQAVIDKNFHWFSRYRTVDAYNVFGGRSRLSWGGQSNADVMRREMEIFDVMTANRDKRVWAVAAGRDEAVDDSNTPPLLTVKTNRPGPLEGGRYPFLGGEAAIDKMTLAEGLEVNLFASEEQFPELINPVQMAVDTDGRLWVATWPTYPHWNPKKALRDKLLILPDEDADGKADEAIVFADGLNSVTGFEFWGGGVIVVAAPDLLFLKDTNGDDRADLKIRLLQGISAEDTHHTANALTIGPDGGLYFSHGIFHVDNMETPTKTFRSTSSGVYRFDPRTYEIDFHFPIGPNPHGIAFDQWGYQFASDGTSGTGAYVSIGKGVGPPKQWYRKRVRPVPAIGFLSSSHFPPENNGNFMICNAIGFLGVLQHRVEYDGADPNAIEIEPIMYSSDPNFRPTDLEIAGDGALYISDWCNPLIGHMQHNIRDPNRDHDHGRVYRVTAKGRPLAKPVKMKGKPIEEVLNAFYAPDNGTRYRARLELSGRDTKEVVATVNKWSEGIGPKTAKDEQALLEALWVCEEHRVPNGPLLRKVLQAQEPRVRAAAIRTLGHWGPKVDGWEPLLLAAARDSESLVRAEAVKAAVSFEGLAAAEAIFEAATRPTDVQLDYVLKYAQGKLNVDAIVQDALRSGKELSLAAQTYVLRNAKVDDLLKMKPSEAVYLAILSRRNVPANSLQSAISGLSTIRKIGQRELLLKMIREQDAEGRESNLPTLGRLLATLPAKDLRQSADEIAAMAVNAKTPAARQSAFAAWVTADGGGHNAMVAAEKSKERLRELLDSVRLVADQDARAAMYDQVRSLMFELPANLAAEEGGASIAESGLVVDYFYPSASNVARETLDGMKPKASGVVPKITINVPQLKQRDKFALRFSGSIRIDKSGKYTFYLSSDDGSRLYIGDVEVINNDGLHGMQEMSGSIELPAGSHPILITYFDNGGGDGLSAAWSGPGFNKQPIPTEKLSAGAPDTLHDVAIRTLNAVPGHHAEKFNDLARLIKSGRHRGTAIEAVQKVPTDAWAANQLRPLADNLVAYLSEIPARFRTGPAASEAVDLVKMLAKKLPAEQARTIERSLENLDVRVIAIGTVPHRMNFDKEMVAVQAGKPVEFRFSNSDNMPHNFAIVAPGSMEEIGLMAEATARDPDAIARHYIPKSDKVLLGSRLLQPGEFQAIAFEAPKEPGIYPYVCTYPGHWRRMFGALYVVEDLTKYEENPVDYLAANPLPLKDDMLKYLQRNREWKFADLEQAINKLAMGHGSSRSFDVGRQLFKVAACASCHKLGGEGHNVGPDLAKLDPKRTLPETLRDVVEPSWRINEKYQSYAFATESGKVVTGLIVEENDDSVKVVTNPAAPDKPTVLAQDEIEARRKSKLSIMPQGVLNKLTEEEILDLMAYVFSRGNKDHVLFKGHDHH